MPAFIRRLIPRLTLWVAFTALLSIPAWAHHDGVHKRKGYRQSDSARFDRGGSETTRERERRLTRECKGRPNSGACEGYTR
jgi:hypothetical protein